MSGRDGPDADGQTGRLVHIGAAAAVTVVIIGFLSGTRAPAPGTLADTAVPGAAAAPPMPTYAGMQDESRGPNAAMYEGAFAALREGLPGMDEPVPPPMPTDRAAALSARADRRAYDGAPPTIPHDIDQLRTPDCLACHDRGVVIAGRIAPTMSHPPYASCTQCHVVERDPRRFGEIPPPPANDFQGLASPGPGTRAWQGAPPTVPHSIWMRSACASCHGITGRHGLRTTHPDRQSCLQCHAPSAILDQQIPVHGMKGAQP